MPGQRVSILLTMNQAQAAALAKFAKHVACTEVRRVATDDKEADLMLDGIDRLLKALNDAGYSSP